MNNKYLLFSLEDEASKNVAEIIGNKTAKKILNYLAENEASESDIANSLNMPVNTIEYNLKKLLKSGLVEKSKNFFWSSKGKKIPTYKAAEKHIIISPKKSQIIKNLTITAVFSFIIAFFIKIYLVSKKGAEQIQEPVLKKSIAGTEQALSEAARISSSQPEIWLWFLGGALIALLIFLILNWRKL